MTPEEYVATIDENDTVREIKRLKGQIATLEVQGLAIEQQASLVRMQIRERQSFITALRYRVDHL